MVINGNTIQKGDLALLKFVGDRVRLTPELVDKARLSGSKPINCWLLVVTPGRYRLLRSPEGTATDDLSRILQQIEEAGATGEVLEGTENNEQAGIRARLIPCVVSPRGPGWRIHFPKAAKQLASEKGEPSHVFAFSVAGFVEFWFPDALRKAVSVPMSEILS
jgi:hypothetical protein